MATRYGNVTLRGVTTDVVVSALRDRGERAWLLPAPEHVVVCTCAADDDPGPLACDLSARVAAPALGAVVHEADLLVLTLALDGEVRDRFVSDSHLPSHVRTGVYFGDAPGIQLSCRRVGREAALRALATAGASVEGAAATPDGGILCPRAPADLRDVARRLSVALHGDVLAMLPRLDFHRFVDGVATPVDFGEEDVPAGGGDATALCAAFGGDAAVVTALLDAGVPARDGRRAEPLHGALSEALGLPATGAGTGFRHLERDDGVAPEIRDRAVLVG